MSKRLFEGTDEALTQRRKETSGRFAELGDDDLAMVSGGASDQTAGTSDYGGCCCKTWGSDCPSCDIVDKSCCPGVHEAEVGSAADGPSSPSAG
ncbi:MAG: hypothetical protein K0V04_27575 [Deltaproteobacteria bacterium]|nr:hypothetical protein [Deltaproteobacteria bacterium]